MKSILSSLSLILLVTTSLFAQNRPDPLVPQGENFQVPDGWEIRLDRPDNDVIVGSNPDSSDIYFVNMTPGWHLTTGPRGIFYHPANMENGDYSIHTSMYLFNPNGRNREGYGLFFGGNRLKSADYQYIYFLIRNTGDFLVKTRTGETTEVVLDWTASDAIVIYDDPEVSSVLNTLAVEVNTNELKFFINDTQVGTIPADDLSVTTDGFFGLRVNHNVNLHVEDLGIGSE